MNGKSFKKDLSIWKTKIAEYLEKQLQWNHYRYIRPEEYI